MPEPAGLEGKLRGAILIVLLAVIVVAPLVGAFAFSPLLVMWGVQPYPLAASLGVMFAESLAIALLYWLVIRAKR